MMIMFDLREDKERCLLICLASCSQLRCSLTLEISWRKHRKFLLVTFLLATSLLVDPRNFLAQAPQISSGHIIGKNISFRKSRFFVL
ncbi:MAG: hypothetical protein LIP12_07135 [Clostridiales bacterium]|nr:hypothetical protein [Clostridiales bacterium]